jgi:hypothetical protein
MAYGQITWANNHTPDFAAHLRKLVAFATLLHCNSASVRRISCTGAPTLSRMPRLVAKGKHAALWSAEDVTATVAHVRRF